MRVYENTYRDRKGRTRKTKNWYVEFTDHKGRVRRMPGFTDKSQTREFGRRVERLVLCRLNNEPADADLLRWLESIPQKSRTYLGQIGVLDPRRLAAFKALADHLEDFRLHLTARDNTAAHVRQTVARVERIVEGCGFSFWSDITPLPVETYVRELQQGDEDLAPQTVNYYVQALKQFCRWMVREGRASASPVESLRPLNARVDRRRVRRALTTEELRSLISTTYSGPDRYRLAGPERAMLYRFAVGTGLRANEIRSLTCADLDLASSPPTVTVRAKNSKRRREDVLPLRSSLAVDLAPFLSGKLPTARALDMPAPSSVARMIALDLEAAGIPYEDEEGRVADFHALRHTMVSNLAASGVHPKTAQTLARHSTISLTMDRYTHVLVESLAGALEGLPDIGLPALEVQRATGTEGDQEGPDDWASCWASGDGSVHTRADAAGLPHAARTASPDVANSTPTRTERDARRGERPPSPTASDPGPFRVQGELGGGTRDRTGESRICNPSPYHLAMPPSSGVRGSGDARAGENTRPGGWVKV